MPNIIIKYFLLILVIIMPYNLTAQKMTVYQEEHNLDIEFKFNAYEDNNSLPNFFIIELSEAQSRMRSFFKYYIKSNSQTKLIKDGNNYILSISIDSVISEGNFTYKGFNFSKACLPETVYYSYSIFENNSKEIQKRKIYLELNSQNKTIFDSNFTDITGLASYTISKEELSYYFHKDQKDNFHKSINYIKQYYSDGEKISNIKKDIVKLDADNIDKLLLQSIDIKYINIGINKIEIPKYESYLSLKETDPAGIYMDYLNTKSLIDSLYLLYISKINVLDSLFYSKGIEYKNDSNNNKSIEYFDKSIDFNPEYFPALYELALYDYNQKKYSDAGIYLNRILEIRSDYIKANELALLNYNAMLQKGIALNKEERFTEGLRILGEAKTFCTVNMHILSCESYQDSAINTARHGIYKSYISIASASMRRGRFDMTEDYLDAASRYQEKFSEAIESNKDAKALYTLLITQYLRLSIESASNKQQSNAYLHHADSIAQLYSLDNAIAFIKQTEEQLSDDSYSNSKAAKEIIEHSKIIEKQEYSTFEIADISPEQTAKSSYRLHIKKGDAYFESGDYSKAYSNYKTANSIKQEFNIDTKDSLSYCINKSAKRSILKQLDKANLNAWAKRFNSANTILNKSLEEIEENNLQEDSMILISLAKVRTELQKKENSEQSKAFNALMKKSRISIDFKDYVSMKSYCDTAISISEEHPKTALNETYPRSLLIIYKNEIHYQLLVLESKEYSKNKDSKKAIEIYKATEDIYDSIPSKISKYTLSKFAKDANNKEVYTYCIQSALNNKETELAFEIWLLADENNNDIAKSTAQECMQKLGLKDNKKYTNSSKKPLYNIRFGNKKSFKKYKKYYYKGLKNEDYK